MAYKRGAVAEASPSAPKCDFYCRDYGSSSCKLHQMGEARGEGALFFLHNRKG